jgi:AcrR family transcriptional regulator
MASVGTVSSTAEHLIDVAGEIFAAKGPSATVREICGAAGCSVAAINYHFGDKQKLYVRCVQAACEQKQRLFPLPRVDSNTAPEQLLLEFLKAVTSRVAGKPGLSWQNTLMLREVLSPSTDVFNLLQSYFEADFATLDKLLADVLGPELNSPQIRGSLETQVLARCMFLRTGKELRHMLQLSSQTIEDPELYAEEIWQSLLLQISGLRQQSQSAMHYPPSNNTSTKL